MHDSFRFYQPFFLIVFSAMLACMGGLLPLWVISAPKQPMEGKAWSLRLLSLPSFAMAVGLVYIYAALEPVISHGKAELFIRPFFWMVAFFVLFLATMGLSLLFRPDLVSKEYNASMKQKLGAAFGKVLLWSLVAEICKVTGEVIAPERFGNPLTIVSAILSGGVQAPICMYLYWKLQDACVPMLIPQIGEATFCTIIVRTRTTTTASPS